MAKKVTIYTTTTCAYCRPVKEFLHQKQQEYEEVNLDEQPERRQELLMITGQLAVPVTVIEKDDGSQEATIGFNLPKLAAALA